MFYVKSKISDDAEIRVELTDENVYSRCLKCGCETLVDIAETFREDGDLFSTAVFCEKCSREVNSDETNRDPIN